MANDYGVYKTNAEGIDEWVVTEVPLTLGMKDAACKWSYPDACNVAIYLGEGFKVGRPGDRQPK